MRLRKQIVGEVQCSLLKGSLISCKVWCVSAWIVGAQPPLAGASWMFLVVVDERIPRRRRRSHQPRCPAAIGGPLLSISAVPVQGSSRRGWCAFRFIPRATLQHSSFCFSLRVQDHLIIALHCGA